MRGPLGGDVLAGLPPAVRWSILGGAVVVLLLFLGVATWVFLEQRRASAERAFAAATEPYLATLGSEEGEPARLEAAAKALRDFLRDYARSGAAAQAWYALGNVEYRRKAYDAALEAYRAAAAHDSGMVGMLARLGAGYAWEAKGDPGQALEVYRAALSGRTANEFLYGELLLATARSQEQLKQADAAVQTYRQFLKELPESPRAAEVRLRLALLGAAA